MRTVCVKIFFRDVASHESNSVQPVQNIRHLFKKNASPLYSHSISANISTSFFLSASRCFSLSQKCFCTFSSLISDITLPFCLYNTILFFFSGPLFFIIVIPFLFLFFCQSPRIRCSIVSSIVAVVGSITTRGSPGASEIVQLETKSEVIRQQNSIINAFLFVSSNFFLPFRGLFFFFVCSNVHTVSNRTSVFSITVQKPGITACRKQ